MTEYELIVSSGVSFKEFEGEYLVPLAETEAVIEACKRNSVPILGIDAFKLVGEQGRMPLMQYDLLLKSFSESTREAWANRTCEEALEFVRSVCVPELYYLFVTDLDD